MRPPKDRTPAEAKQKTLSIHIATDHVGPHGMPLVYGSTLDKIGTIKGVVRFSSNYDCKGRDIVIMYEAKAEAQWTVLENKKIVNHHTEEMFGHHIWHFPLEHTKPKGHTVAAGVYEKEFEVSLVHPSAQNRSSTPSPTPSSPSAIIHTSTNTPSRPVALLPSSSYSPYAKMKYTIRAILRRPFPCVTNIEASQEVWVVHSSLPPPAPPRPLTQPPISVVVDHKHCGSGEVDPSTSTLTVDTTPAVSTSPKSPELYPPSEALQESSLPSEAHQELSLPSEAAQECTPPSSESFIALVMHTKIKSALSMFPSINLSRPKHLFPLFMPTPSTPKTPAFQVEQDQSVTNAAQSSIIIPTSHFSESSSEPKSSNASASSRSSSRSSIGSARRKSHESDDSGLSDEDSSASYTGIWEPFNIPYSCSVLSETVYPGQRVPVTIRFGPRKGDYRKRCDERRNGKEGKREDGDRRRNTQHGHKYDPHGDNHVHDQDIVPSGPRFVVKKGIVKVVEHTLLREVSVMPVPSKLQSQRQGRDLTFKQQHSEQQQSSDMLAIPGYTNDQTPEKIYQNHTYNGSYSHLYDLSHRETLTENPARKTGIQEQEKEKEQQGEQEKEQPPQGHRHVESNDLKKRFFFMPKRYSLDISTKNIPSPPQSPTPVPSSRDTSPTSPLSPLYSLPPRSPPPSSINMRIINTVEAKFKTEALAMSVTSHLQQRERRYLRHLYRKKRLGKTLQSASIGDDANEQRHEDDEDDYEEDEDHEEDHDRDEGDEDDGVWETTLWVQLPGPSELSTFTETKHMVKRHTLQLILLCGLVDAGEDASGPSALAAAEPRLGGGIGPDSVITQPGVNKEFRLEMDLYVTGPREPA